MPRPRRRDVAISTAFGPNYLQVFKVWTDEVKDAENNASITGNSAFGVN